MERGGFDFWPNPASRKHSSGEWLVNTTGGLLHRGLGADSNMQSIVSLNEHLRVFKVVHMHG